MGSILVTAFTVAFIFFFALHYILKVDSISDCAWHGSARAWIDSNRDGRIDQDEPPLDHVEIHVQDVRNQFVVAGDAGWSAITDKDGDVQFNIPIPDCTDTVFEIYADIPNGYQVTTKPHIEVNSGIWESLDTDRVYYFGFVLER
ncbi:MAG: hypothetical protein EHM33_20230 [Chloroflexi bacterium]|nr:MAG: hypothetical protein EHM33_20230 [Chloroflexota bacterium]